MTKTIAVDEATWKKLRALKDKLGLQSYNDVINILVERWHVSEIKEAVDTLSLDLEPQEAVSILKSMRKMRAPNIDKQ
jgi:predicted CopG family antitoxin